MKLEQLNEEIQKNNEVFAKLSKADKRVQIAKDCIARLEFKQVMYETGTVLSAKTLARLKEAHDDVKTTLTSPIKCTACAKGGLFLSYVGRANNYTKHNIDGTCSQYSNEHDKLLEIFTITQLSLIETAFEGYQFITTYNGKDITLKNIKDAENFFNVYYSNDNERMIAICENIIKNKGTFKP